MRLEDARSIYATGVTAATGAASARFAIPVNSAGQKPRYVRVAAVSECYVRLGDGTVVATANDLLIQPGDSIILVVGSATNIAHIQGTAVGKVNVIPLDDE